MFFRKFFLIFLILTSVFAEFHISSREIVNVVNTNSFKFNELCVSHLNYFQDNLDSKVLWARKFRDSWGEFPSGVFTGNVYDFGNFDQCVKFNHYSNEVGEILGQHCTLMIQYDLDGDSALMARFMMPKKNSEINVGIGICFPTSCDPQQVKQIADEYLMNQFNVTTTSYDQQTLCSKAPQPVKFNKLRVFAM